MPPEITRLTKQFLRDPIRIEASRPATAAETIVQYLVPIPSADPKAKRTALRELISRADVKNGIVFCNRKSEVDIVAKSLKTHGLDAAPIHGDLDQQTRMRTLEAFRNGSLRLLCASDVAARGLDIPDVSHVFNYDVPHHADDYVHRIGRTGRAGKTGQAFMIATPADSRNLDKVLKLIGTAPETIKLDIDWSSIKEEPRRPRNEGGRGGDRKPRDRDRGRERPVPVHGEVASMTPFDPTTAPPPAAEPAPRPEREGGREGVREGGRGRSRGRRGEPRQAAEQPAAEAAPPAREARAERPPRPERPLPPPPEQTPRAERPQRDRLERDRPDRGRDRHRSGREEGDDGVVGFGQDVPAFLSKPPR